MRIATADPNRKTKLGKSFLTSRSRKLKDPWELLMECPWDRGETGLARPFVIDSWCALKLSLLISLLQWKQCTYLPELLILVMPFVCWALGFAPYEIESWDWDISTTLDSWESILFSGDFNFASSIGCLAALWSVISIALMGTTYLADWSLALLLVPFLDFVIAISFYILKGNNWKLIID